MNNTDFDNQGSSVSDAQGMAKWQKPELVKLQAEWAELGDFASPDGAIAS